MASDAKKTGASGGKKHASKRHGGIKRLRGNKKKLRGVRQEDRGTLLETRRSVLDREEQAIADMMAHGVHPKAAVRGTVQRRMH